MPTPTPLALAEARATGASHYFTGKPCKNGHISLRSTRNSRCLECMREWQKDARARDPAYFARKERKKLYGLEEQQYQQMLQEQMGCCAICDSQMTAQICVDHCHTTGQVRGLLCHHCNFILGHARDNVETLARAIAYLQR